MTPEYRSELRGKRRGFLEMWTRLGAEIRQIDEVLGEQSPPCSECIAEHLALERRA